MVFVLYLVSGFLRRRTYGKAASKVKPLFIGLGAFVALLGVYAVVRFRTQPQWNVVVNGAAVFASFTDSARQH